MILANKKAKLRAYQYYVTVCSPSKQFREYLVFTVHWFVCLTVAMTTSLGNGVYCK